MKKEMIVRAWKDPAYRASLSDKERASLPESPSGRAMTELEDDELLGISGGRPPPNYSVDTFRCAATQIVGCPRTINSCGIVACV
ncbi:mersacidin/lichenicidin family type 2 lantibiotic [Archangium violaceum]|uniref:mersacidin/lichenicidin family type 2 lantibiotic n=1 Tax=Archangium violaceum TaxID=83451 RepID=UPI002B2B4C6B|nr:mersacidin/lichenicidin family type 2 lantibiotic [Archangium gephyra]